MSKLVNGLVCGLLLIVCVYFLILRFTNLSTSPSGFFVDESSTAFNAYSILKTGQDEHGVAYPIYFEAFGEFKNPIYIYSQIPLIKIFGLTRDSARGASALWGLATIVLFVVFLRLQRFRLAVILFGAAVFLASPWHLVLSRIAFEVVSYPFFLVLAIFSLWLFQSQGRRDFRFFLVFTLALGLAFYSYTSGRLLSPAFLIFGIILFYRDLSVRKIGFSILLFVICLLPAAVWEFFFPGSLQARYEVVGLSNYTKGWLDFSTTFIKQYIAHFSPNFLFGGGDGNLRHSLSWHSLYLWVSIPFLLAGFISLVKKRTKFGMWIIFSALLSFVPSALTIQAPHALRAVGYLPFGVYLISLGANWFIQRPKFQILWGSLIVAFCIETFLVADFFNKNYREASGIWFDDDTYRSIQVASSTNRPIFLSSRLYPGTLETARFITTKKDGVVVVEPGQTLGSGVYVVTQEECVFGEIIFSNSSTCVLNFKSMR